MVFDHRAVDRTELGPSRLEIGAGREPTEQFGHPMHASVHHRRVEVVRTGDDVRDDFGSGG